MDIEKIIREAGFLLVRQRKHKVFRHSVMNKTLVMSSTPSDVRTEHHVVAQVARLVGKRKHNLLAVKRRKRVRPVKPEVPIALLEPMLPPIPQLHVPPVYSKADLKKLRRMEKHEAQEAVKYEKQRKKLAWLVQNAHEVFEESRDSGDGLGERHDYTVRALLEAAQHLGYHDSEIMLAEVKFYEDGVRHMNVVRAGRWYLDYMAQVVSDKTTWRMVIPPYGEVGTVEVFGALRLIKDKESWWIEE
jgi:predicted RNA binding protein YcfA (HicA-like mRNA interferase family)